MECDESQLIVWVPSMIIVFCPLGRLSSKKAVTYFHLSFSMTSHVLFLAGDDDDVGFTTNPTGTAFLAVGHVVDL